MAQQLRDSLGVDPELGGLVARATQEASVLLETLAALEARGGQGEAKKLREQLAAQAARPPADEA